jgi:3-deoxy-manno-octulosonate cytidylyltransferase (CMP-KDO synthetase)
MEMEILGIIPARYASTRLPGKPLVEINGKPMIQLVYEQAIQSKMLKKVVVATDNDKIFNQVQEFGGEVIMTSPQHQSGTDRCAEIIGKPNQQNWDVIVNIQGDEPFIKPTQIDLLCKCFEKSETQIATLIKEIQEYEELFNHNNVKVIINKYKQALYFSRSPVPYCRNFPEQEWLKQNTYYKHIGIYGYRAAVLREIAALPKTKLEITESLEQLRWLENAYVINTEVTTVESMAVDTPEDLLRIRNAS